MQNSREALGPPVLPLPSCFKNISKPGLLGTVYIAPSKSPWSSRNCEPTTCTHRPLILDDSVVAPVFHSLKRKWKLDPAGREDCPGQAFRKSCSDVRQAEAQRAVAISFPRATCDWCVDRGAMRSRWVRTASSVGMMGKSASVRVWSKQSVFIFLFVQETYSTRCIYGIGLRIWTSQ